MKSTKIQSVLSPLIVPATLAFGFLYVYWNGYTVDSPNPVHSTLALVFTPNVATIGAALGVSIWAIYSVIVGLRNQRASAEQPFDWLALSFQERLRLRSLPAGRASLPQIAEALRLTPLSEDDLPRVAGELGAFLGQILCHDSGGRWSRKEDPELGPFAYQASSVLLPQDPDPPLQINVFSVALRALQNADELLRFSDEIDGFGSQNVRGAEDKKPERK